MAKGIQTVNGRGYIKRFKYGKVIVKSEISKDVLILEPDTITRIIKALESGGDAEIPSFLSTSVLIHSKVGNTEIIWPLETKGEIAVFEYNSLIQFFTP